MSIDEAPPAHRALDAAHYHDPGRARWETEAIFRRTWQIGALAGDVAEPGSYATSEIGGVPVVITRDLDGQLHALVNVCPHRAMLIAAGSGRARLLQCPNHAWVFSLAGELRSVPRADREPGFCRAGLDLRRAAVHEWGPIVLVNLDVDAEPPLRELAALASDLEGAGVDLAALEQRGPVVDWDIGANWKIVCENYLECYHCALVHRSFSKVFDVSAERYALAGEGDLLAATAPVRETTRREAQQAVLATDGAVEGSLWHLLFPAATFNLYPGPGALEITWYWPLDAETTLGRTAVFVAAGASDEYAQQVADLALQVGDEDNRLCETMHRGMATGALERARILEVNEALLVRFQARVRELAGD